MPTVQKINGHPVDPKAWVADLSTVEPLINDKGLWKPCYANAVLMLRREGTDWPLRHDLFSEEYYLGEETLRDCDLRTIHEWMQQRGVVCSKDICDQAVFRVAELNKFHQVKDWLDVREWDGVSRLDLLLIDHAGAADTDITKAMTRKWFIQAVARIYEPGCQADTTLILEGAQGLGKSSLLRNVFGDQWFTDQLPDLKDKDASIQLQGVWCVEIAELATMRRSTVENVKQFLSRRVDRFRKPYGRIAEGKPRQTVFAGTVNPGAMGYLHDDTGARRFWPIRIGDDVRVDAFYDNREQIWAESVAAYKAGEAWHLNNQAHAADANVLQRERYESDPWLEPIENYLHSKEKTDLASIFADVLLISSMADRGQAEMNRIARCLSHLGWERARVTDNITGKRKWVYRKVGQTGPILGQQTDTNYQQSVLDLEVPVDDTRTDHSEIEY